MLDIKCNEVQRVIDELRNIIEENEADIVLLKRFNLQEGCIVVQYFDKSDKLSNIYNSKIDGFFDNEKTFKNFLIDQIEFELKKNRLDLSIIAKLKQ